MKINGRFKRIISMMLVTAFTIGLVSTSFVFATDESQASENTTVYASSDNEPTDNNWSGSYTSRVETIWTRYWTYEHDYTELLDNSAPCDTNLSLSVDPVALGDSRIYISPEWGGGFLAKNSVNNYNGDALYSYCYHEVGEHTSTLKIVNPNATDSQITSYFNDQVSKGNIQKLTVAFWDSGKNYADNGSWRGDWDYDHIVVNRSATYTDSDLPSVHAGELLSELDGLVNFVPDGTYTWTDLCSMCDVIICPYGLSQAQVFWCSYYSMEYLAFDGYDPRGDIYYRFSDYSYNDYSLTKAETFAIMYGDSLHKIESCEGLYRSVMCQLGKMDVDGTVIIGSDICYGHEYEAQKYDIDYFGTEGSNGIISLKCKYCGDVETIQGCNTSIISPADPTCTQDGSATYKVSGTYSWETISGYTESQPFSGNMTVIVSATGHDYTEGGVGIEFRPVVVSEANGNMRQAIVDYAESYLGYPYVVGGRGDTMWPDGVNNTGSDIVFDCSGFTQYVYMNALADRYGVAVSFATDDNRWTPEGQWDFPYAYNISVDDCSGWSDFIAKLEPGDLIFFNEQANGKPGHVGIYIGNGQMIDANSNSNIMQVTNETLSNEVRNFSTCMGAKRIIFEIGEMFPATMSLSCRNCNERITVDAVAELTYGTSATCGYTGTYEFHTTTYFDGNMYGTWTEGNSPSTTGHDWDYDHAYLENINVNGDTYVVITCKKCGGQMMSKVESPSYSVQQLSWSYAEDDYGMMVLTLTALYYDENGEEHIYTQEITDIDKIEEINESHDWELVKDSYVAPTCTTDGYAEYICNDCGAIKDVTYEAYGHNWTIEFVWNDDYTECIANVVCSECGDIQDNIIAEINAETDENGTTYIATIVWNGEVYSDEVFVEFQQSQTTPSKGKDNSSSDNGNNENGTIDNTTDNTDNIDTDKAVSSVNDDANVNNDTYDNIGNRNNIIETVAMATEDNANEDSGTDINVLTISQSDTATQETSTIESAKTDGDSVYISLIVSILTLFGIVAVITIRKRNFNKD